MSRLRPYGSSVVLDVNAVRLELLKGVKLLSGQSVRTVSHDDWKVQVVVEGGADGDDQTLTFDYVFIAAAADSTARIAFSPQWPQWKAEAVNALAVSHAAVVTLEWTESLSSLTIGQSVALTADDDADDAAFAAFTVVSCVPLIVRARIHQAADDADVDGVIRRAVTALRRLSSKAPFDWSAPPRVNIRQWRSESAANPQAAMFLSAPVPSPPLFLQSSSSFIPAQYNPATTRLFFAGAYTSRTLTHSLSAAFASGSREADRLVDIIAKRLYFGAEQEEMPLRDTDDGDSDDTDDASRVRIRFCLLCYGVYGLNAPADDQLGALNAFYCPQTRFRFDVHEKCIEYASETMKIDRHMMNAETEMRKVVKAQLRTADKNVPVASAAGNGADGDDDESEVGDGAGAFVWFNVCRAVRRCISLACSHCGHGGAAIDCHAAECTHSYHFMCARGIGYDFDADDAAIFYCPMHRRYTNIITHTAQQTQENVLAAPPMPFPFNDSGKLTRAAYRQYMIACAATFCTNSLTSPYYQQTLDGDARAPLADADADDVALASVDDVGAVQSLWRTLSLADQHAYWQQLISTAIRTDVNGAGAH